MPLPDIVIIGAGQAGLAMSYHLQRHGLAHVLLERGRVAERWRSERWDSLCFQFPNRYLRLPGMAYRGEDPDGFMHRDGVVDFLEAYAREIDAPVRSGVNVKRITQHPDGLLEIISDQFTGLAHSIVVATGPYQITDIPSVAVKLPPRVQQLTASSYIRPAQLPDGAVLVIGAGGSGCQIAEDLVDQGRDVYLSVGRHRRLPRRYRGQDFAYWAEAVGLLDQTREETQLDAPAPLLTGAKGGHDIDPRMLAGKGVRLLGRLLDCHGAELVFDDNLDAMLIAGDVSYNDLIERIDLHAGEPAPPAESVQASKKFTSPGRLDLAAADIQSIIWATGYRFDFNWLPAACLTESGSPRHTRGETFIPGLYFLGLPYQYKVRSAFLWGVGDDAEFLADRISARR